MQPVVVTKDIEAAEDFEDKLRAVRRLTSGQVNKRSRWREYTHCTKRCRQAENTYYVEAGSGRHSWQPPAEGVNAVVLLDLAVSKASLGCQRNGSSDSPAKRSRRLPCAVHKTTTVSFSLVIAVLDTNALLIPHQFKAVRTLGSTSTLGGLLLVVPMAVQLELQSIGRQVQQDDTESTQCVNGRAHYAQAALRWLQDLQTARAPWLLLQTSTAQRIADYHHAADTTLAGVRELRTRKVIRLSADDSILACCRLFHDHRTPERRVVLLSEDAVLAIKAIAHGCVCQSADQVAAEKLRASSSLPPPPGVATVASMTGELPATATPAAKPSSGATGSSASSTTCSPTVIVLLHHSVLMDDQELLALSALMHVAKAGALLMIVTPSALACLDTFKSHEGTSGYQARRGIKFIRTHLDQPWFMLHTTTSFFKLVTRYAAPVLSSSSSDAVLSTSRVDAATAADHDTLEEHKLLNLQPSLATRLHRACRDIAVSASMEVCHAAYCKHLPAANVLILTMREELLHGTGEVAACSASTMAGSGGEFPHLS